MGGSLSPGGWSVPFDNLRRLGRHARRNNKGLDASPGCESVRLVVEEAVDLQRLFAPIRSTRTVLVAMMSVDPLATYAGVTGAMIGGLSSVLGVRQVVDPDGCPSRTARRVHCPVRGGVPSEPRPSSCWPRPSSRSSGLGLGTGRSLRRVGLAAVIQGLAAFVAVLAVGLLGEPRAEIGDPIRSAFDVLIIATVLSSVTLPIALKVVDRHAKGRAEQGCRPPPAEPGEDRASTPNARRWGRASRVVLVLATAVADRRRNPLPPLVPLATIILGWWAICIPRGPSGVRRLPRLEFDLGALPVTRGPRGGPRCSCRSRSSRWSSFWTQRWAGSRRDQASPTPLLCAGVERAGIEHMSLGVLFAAADTPLGY